LQYASWRWVFVAQAALAAATLALTVAIYSETLHALDPVGLRGMVARFGRLAGNRGYVLANGSTGLLSAPFLGFVAFSPLAYIVHFGMSEQQFALLFGANALCVIAGSAACSQLVGRYSERVLLPVAFGGCLTGGVVLLLATGAAWPVFAAGMATYSFFFGVSRPLVNHLVLEQVDRDIGAAASAIVCYQFLCGAAGMAIATQQWSRPFLVFGVLATACPLVTLALWPVLRARLERSA
jgi:DHA1 family bicyclomycin/chloramphenicol resistance-like MFS transporter